MEQKNYKKASEYVACFIQIMVVKTSRRKCGRGLFNTFLNNLKTPILYPGYEYLGPGNNLQKQLRENIQPVNELDSFAREHDIAYSKYRDTKTRHIHDKKLENQAWGIVKNLRKPTGERVAAYITTNLMKGKRLLGMGAKGRKKKGSAQRGGTISFASAVKKAKRNFKKNRDLKTNIEHALLAIKKEGKKVKIPKSRIIPIPQKGGVLPLAAILAALGTAGTVASNVSKIAEMIGAIRSTKDKLFGKGMGGGSMKVMNGVYLRPHKKGMGLYFNPQRPPHRY